VTRAPVRVVAFATLALASAAHAAGVPAGTPGLFEIRSGAPDHALVVSAAGAAPVFGLGPLALRLDAEASTRSTATATEGVRLRTGAWAELPLRGAIAWAGLSVDRYTGRPERPGSPTLELGARAARGPLSLSARARHRTPWVPQQDVRIWSWSAPSGFHAPPDTFPDLPYWFAQGSRLESVSTLEAAAEWRRGRWDLGASVGLGLGARIAPFRLARIEATRWMRPGLGVLLGAKASEPHWLDDSPIDRGRLELGLRYAPGQGAPSARATGRAAPPVLRCTIVPLSGGRYAFRLEADRITRATLRGDFTGWEPVELRRAGLGWWEATFAATPGVHAVELSLDGGAWQPPPGLPAASGPFGEARGTFVTR
jgi:hypothetical protein